ncbi:MAG TPA: protein phosphatase 2C domain-containing protein, partial [Gemmataceae bacterium]|nr:protein phosphatase 2C domain-containing protein [Gemmataceae bacterium]
HEAAAPVPVEEPMTAAEVCSHCQAPRAAEAGFCAECGYIFAADVPGPATTVVPDALVAGRYRLTELIGERGGVARFRGEDVGAGDPFPVVVVRQSAPEPAPPVTSSKTDEPPTSAFDFDLPASTEQATEELPSPAAAGPWPGVAWEQAVLLRAAHLSLPRLIDSFTVGGFVYLVEEVPPGTPLWDAWDGDEVTHRDRFGWLVQLAEALDRLHAAGAIMEGLRPEMVVVSPSGMCILADLAGLLPHPLPGDVPLRGDFSTAPELLLNPTEADARADLYAFGALVYALVMGRELSELDFTLTGMPKAFLEREPDANPFLARLLGKTFVREPDDRFPTHDGADIDPTGFRELVAALNACRRNLDRVKIDVAGWSTVGIARLGNEDAVVVHHVSEGRLDDSDEAALILLADGMGGMESGELAAAMALQTLRQCLLAGPPFAASLPSTPVTDDLLKPSEPAQLPAGGSSEPLAVLPPPLPVHADTEAPERTTDALAERVRAALVEANRQVFEAAHAHPDARGMGCTAEVVLVDGRTAILGHVGDSRVYRMRRGKLGQVTRDQTVVARLVELGQLTESEAETHPRRSELQQAIGGRPDIYPEVYSVALAPGDWLLVCSDGLSNQVPGEAIQAVLREARNAERAARRLVNLTLAEGALDNVTVAVVRVS